MDHQERLQLRARCLGRLLMAFSDDRGEDGGPLYDPMQFRKCAAQWVNEGHTTADGILPYFHKNYGNTG